MPSAASGETLSERANRLLGLDLDSWLSTELRSDPHSARGNRHEQIAQAQRKHRQRTQSYIQALEEEVLRLRGVELSLKGELEDARGHIQDELPSSTNLGPMNNENAIMVRWDELYKLSPVPGCCIAAAENTPPEPTWTFGQNGIPQVQPPPSSWAEAFAVASLDMSSTSNGAKTIASHETMLTLEMGVQYILQLERPCMPHLRNATLGERKQEAYIEVPYNFGTNHAYNLSTRLFNEFTSPDSPRDARITAQDLENLLEASSRLELVNELTPVQVWALVCKLDGICRIDPVLVANMFDGLSNYSYCNSYGTAITKTTIKAAFQHFLGWSDSL